MIFQNVSNVGHYVLRPFCDLCILCLGPFYAVGRFEPLAVLCRGPFWALVMSRVELGPFLGWILHVHHILDYIPWGKVDVSVSC
jgi:hypothetical protein